MTLEWFILGEDRIHDPLDLYMPSALTTEEDKERNSERFLQIYY